MIYQWRIHADDHKESIRRIEEERLLSIGWSGNETNLRLSDTDFILNCKKRYNLKTTRTATSLSRIRNIKNGDIIITPNLPKHGYVSFHVVNGDFIDCYDYKSSDKTHTGHRIKILKSYGMDCSISINTFELNAWKAKLRWLRLPVLKLKKYEHLFLEIMNSIDTGKKTVFVPSSLDGYFDKVRDSLVGSLRKTLAQVSPSGGNISFEKICERIIISYGYKVVRRNTYDGDGGDIDLVCARETTGPSPFGDSRKVIVQVKKHSGTTSDTSVKQILQMKSQDKHQSADCCVMSLGDKFSEKAEELATANGVLLLNGNDIAGMFLKYIADTGQ